MKIFTSLCFAPLLVSSVAAGCKGSHRSQAKMKANQIASSSRSSSTSSSSASSPSGTGTGTVQLNANGGTHPVSITANASSSSSSSSSSTSSSSGTDVGWGFGNGMMAKNGIYFGFLPDDGSGGGTAQSMSQINSAMASTAATQGWYAQAQSGTLFDGSQLTSRMDQIVAAGAVFQPAVMPTGGWWGLTSNDNQQAVAICNVMKQFTDKGLEVWLRFAHEVNYYQTDGTYQGSADDFKQGWATVAAACKQIAPSVKMWFTPNIANLDQYDEYYPDDPNTVDLIGIDFYPQETSGFDFVGVMKPFHDKYTNSRVKFAIGETGLGTSAGINTRLAWLQDMTSSTTASQMTNYIACSWFNYYKGYDFRVAAVSGDTIVKQYLTGSS